MLANLIVPALIIIAFIVCFGLAVTLLLETVLKRGRRGGDGGRGGGGGSSTSRRP